MSLAGCTLLVLRSKLTYEILYLNFQNIKCLLNSVWQAIPLPKLKRINVKSFLLLIRNLFETKISSPDQILKKLEVLNIPLIREELQTVKSHLNPWDYKSQCGNIHYYFMILLLSVPHVIFITWWTIPTPGPIWETNSWRVPWWTKDSSTTTKI